MNYSEESARDGGREVRSETSLEQYFRMNRKWKASADLPTGGTFKFDPRIKATQVKRVPSGIFFTCELTSFSITALSHHCLKPHQFYERKMQERSFLPEKPKEVLAFIGPWLCLARINLPPSLPSASFSGIPTPHLLDHPVGCLLSEPGLLLCALLCESLPTQRVCY